MSKLIKTTLENICLNEKKSIISGPFGSNISSKFFISKGIPVIRGSNLSLSYKKFIENEFAFISKEKADELNCYAYRKDIIFTIAGTIGQVGIIPDDSKFTEYVISNKQARVRINEKIVDNLYVYYWLSSPLIQDKLKNSNKGSTVPLLTLSEIKDIPIIYPIDNNLQKKISNFLEGLSKKIELNNKINDNLEQQVKLLYDYWFSQFDFPDENGKPYCSSGGKMVRNKQLKRNIPENWKVVPLSTVLKFKSGFSFSSDLYVSEGKHKLITIKNVQDSGINLKVDNYINDVPSNVPDYCFLEVNDILMSLTGNVGRIGIMYDSGCLLNQRVALTKSLNEDLHSFVYFLLKSDIIRKQYEIIANGSSQKNLSPLEAEDVLFAYNEQIAAQFSSVTNKHLKIIVSNLTENENLIHLREWLLPILMNGQATIRD